MAVKYMCIEAPKKMRERERWGRCREDTMTERKDNKV